jgi:hypothetical protein
MASANSRNRRVRDGGGWRSSQSICCLNLAQAHRVSLALHPHADTPHVPSHLSRVISGMAGGSPRPGSSRRRHREETAFLSLYVRRLFTGIPRPSRTSWSRVAPKKDKRFLLKTNRSFGRSTSNLRLRAQAGQLAAFEGSARIMHKCRTGVEARHGVDAVESDALLVDDRSCGCRAHRGPSLARVPGGSARGSRTLTSVDSASGGGHRPGSAG